LSAAVKRAQTGHQQVREQEWSEMIHRERCFDAVRCFASPQMLNAGVVHEQLDAGPAVSDLRRRGANRRK